ncbi:MAG: aminotransferase class I/II-fold pyridoxal phosphate-dependent enzyme [Pseudonocardiaceae bacterium]|nr:aminotransferase class I/II-fold pyridoxal phosphate-dependent enzyme [Pseudonocardiaceae bacterium]
MDPAIPPGGRVSGRRLATLLGNWRSGGSRHGAADLAAGIELLVLDGRLPAGTRLPAEREMAESIAISRTMVAAALETLRDEGLVASRRGAGSWITAPAVDRPAEHPAQPNVIDFGRAVPPAIHGVTAAFDAARLRLCEELGRHGYEELGRADLRARIAERYTARGLPTSPEQVMVTNGAHHAFVLALRTLAGPGDRVLVEQPTYPNALDAIRAAHAVPVPVAMDENGWDLPAFDAVLRQANPRLAYLIVDFHNPTGLRLDEAGRERLARTLRKARTVAVVDETQVELDLEGEPEDGPRPLAAFAEDWTITVGSAAKSHWGGFRLGWVRTSAELQHRMIAARPSIDLGSPLVEQLVLAELMARCESPLRGRRAELRVKRDLLVDALKNNCPQWTFNAPEGGLSLWCWLPAPVGTRIAVAAANHGIRLPPASRFGVHGGLERRVRLHWALDEEAITDSVRRLATAAASVRSDVALLDNDQVVPVV